MTQTRNQPIPRSAFTAPENVHVEWIDPIPPPRQEIGRLDSCADALTTGFALTVVALGVLAAAMLVGWSMFRVADLLGLLSS